MKLFRLISICTLAFGAGYWRCPGRVLAEAEIASEIYSIAGDFDILAKFYVESDVDIGHFVGQKVQVIPGIVDTRTIITFRAF